MSDAVIVAAVRSAIGKKKGALANTRADDLLALVLKSLVERAKVEPKHIEDVIAGCVTQIGEQGFNVARTAALMAGFPIETTGTTVNRQCGSSQQAFHFAAQAVMSGALDVGRRGRRRVDDAHPDGLRRGDGRPRRRRGHSRSRRCSPRSSPSCRSTVGGDGRREVGHVARATARSSPSRATSVPRRRARAGASATRSSASRSRARRRRDHLRSADEGIRPDTTLEKLAGAEAVVKADGVVTAGTSSQISDGAAALLVTTPEKAKQLGLKPRARVKAMAVAGVDPTMMLHGVIPATQKALAKVGPEAVGHRAGRDQRGVRVGGAGVVEGAQVEPRQRQRQRRRGRARPSARLLGRAPHDDAAPRDGEARRQVRPADDVHRLRPGDLHHPRAPVARAPFSPS